MPASRKPARSRLFLARLPFGATCRSVSLISLSVAPGSSGRLRPHRRDRNMHRLKLREDNSQSCLIILIAFGALAVLPACNINVKKDSEGQEKKVDIETPIGQLHVSKSADVRDTGLPVYPGARRKEKGDDGNESSANVNISSELFGLKVVAVQYVSDDPPEKLVD